MAQGTLLGSVVTYMGKEFFKEGIYIVFFLIHQIQTMIASRVIPLSPNSSPVANHLSDMEQLLGRRMQRNLRKMCETWALLASRERRSRSVDCLLVRWDLGTSR